MRNISVAVIGVAVIGGTPVDTKMGMDFLKSKGIESVGYPVSHYPEEQSKIQILSPFELTNKISNIINKIKYENINLIIIYCNSISAAVDMDKLSRKKDIRIITPFDIYKKIAYDYSNLGVITANNQSAAGIEKVIQSVNPNCNVVGLGILPLVMDIERGMLAAEIVEKYALKSVMGFYNAIGVDAVILGCTHFPYLYSELKKLSNVPILDPAELMYKMI